MEPIMVFTDHRTDGSYTVCPGSSDPFYIVTYYIKWVTTSWTYFILTMVLQLP